MILFLLFLFQVSSIVDSTYISKQCTHMEPKKAGQKRFTKIAVLMKKFLSNITFKWKIELSIGEDSPITHVIRNMFRVNTDEIMLGPAPHTNERCLC